jgi:transcription-repair coupling factor (superfamily II helicase)
VQLEASFPYEETEDQLKAIEDVKRDMESPEPMDRLVLGDTGFGKTEIAVRAAFKAVADSAQVALIAPTTILVQQHYNTFCERMSRFPVNIEQLSRFRTKKECEEVIRGLANGDVDIVIGTHRLLSKDISFSNLGLVIIDEEQRFGVRQKERLKRFRETVDVLSITATPIPRTLYLSLSGIRKMSFINTPPIGRQPIVTEVAVFTPSLVKSAILKELKRDGQVFFVHNSIETIEEIKNLLLEIVPGIRLEIAHGRMKTSELEEVMLRFIEGEADLLLSTSIIESGLDFPRVNTIIINNAHQFGLADLYQLRGRVGRSYIKAYAYLLYPKDIRMTPEMAERLSAIYEFCELGSGIRLAMRDLQIRGAGNLLGPEQHGNITAVGLELYTRMLAEAVDALKGGSDRAPSSVYIDLPVDAYIPQEFIDDSAERFEFYKRLACGEDPDKIYQEMRDRFGVPPASVDNLIEIHRIRKMTEEIGIREVKVQGDHILLSLPQALSDKAERVADSFGLQFSSCRLKIKRCSLYELAKIVRGLC